jgi:FdhD protein
MMDSVARALPAGIRTISVRRQGDGLETDYVAVEEPLEIQLDGRSLVVTMRTPGHDTELAAGFLHSEGVVSNAEDIESLQSEPESIESDLPGLGAGPAGKGDRVRVRLRTPPETGAIERAQREFRATAACGVCGKEKLEDLEQELPEIRPVSCSRALLEALPQRLRQEQELFKLTGGIHAAGLFTLNGELLCVREDVGRHNAVDKLVGHFFLKGEMPLRDRILVVSGRAGFELVQKALKAAIPVMVSVGAASSLAVEMATQAGMALYSFVAPGRGNLHV